MEYQGTNCKCAVRTANSQLKTSRFRVPGYWLHYLVIVILADWAGAIMPDSLFDASVIPTSSFIWREVTPNGVAVRYLQRRRSSVD